MSRCACGGTLSVVWSGENRWRVKCSNPHHALSPTAFGEVVSPATMQKITGPRMRVVNAEWDQAVDKILADMSPAGLARLIDELEGPHHDATNG